METTHPRTPVTVRVRSDIDLPAAAAVLEAVYESDGYPVEGVADPIAWLTGAGLLQAWVADRDGVTVGHVALSRPDPGDAAATLWAADHPADAVGVLGRLFVSPRSRGTGAAQQLLAAAEAFARGHGLRLTLDVMAKDVAAVRLYERYGWRRIGETQHDDGTGRLIPALCYVGPPGD